MDLTKYSTFTQDQPYGKTSSKYKMIPTSAVHDLIEAKGFECVDYQEAYARTPEKRGYQPHVLRYRNPAIARMGELEKGDIIPEMLLSNSHSGDSCFTFQLGLYRCFCSNQCVSLEAEITSVKVRHIGFSSGDVRRAIEETIAAAPQLAERVKQFQTIDLTPNQQAKFVMAAGDIKHQKKPGEIYRSQFLRMLDRARRPQDKGLNLWKVYNRTQENVIKGGVFRFFESPDGNYRKAGNAFDRFDRHKTQAIRSPLENVKVNAKLWQLTAKLADQLS